MLTLLLPFQKLTRPVFIIGCGRSGTTILGKTLSCHRRITYLEEPRHLWFSAFPESDIWADDARARQTKMVLSGEDVRPRQARVLRRAFHRETVQTGRPTLVEKLPINNFRLECINRVFPEARFIHIYRHGLEVAQSIARLCEAGGWFKTKTYKWEKLVEYAQAGPDTAELPDLCSSYFEQGLLEWRLSVSAAIEFFGRLPRHRVIETSYAELVDHPAETLAQILGFLGLDEDPAVAQFASANIRRKSANGMAPITENTRVIGGRLLDLSRQLRCGLTAAALKRNAAPATVFEDGELAFAQPA